MSAPGITRRQSGVTHAMGGCFDCNGSDAIWTARNAVACAARHATATGHHTWAEQVIASNFNRPEK